jgi:hypothetical protein
VSGLLIHDFCCIHFLSLNLVLIFSKLFLEFKHIFRENVAFCRLKTLWFARILAQKINLENKTCFG